MTSDQLAKTTLENLKAENISVEKFVENLRLYNDILEAEDQGGEIPHEEVLKQAFGS